VDEESKPPDDATAQQPDAEPDRQAQPVDAEQPPRLPFPVVGIGASAGGLEAVGEFLDAMRPDSGMAFVLVQHLPPDRESMMAEILARRTAMPVAQVEDGMPVEPDHVYVIRPGHVLTIRDGRLHLGPRLDSPRAANRPIDDFFKSLAEEQRERAVCIILSGMGSNGTAGAQAVKAVGGLCIAQDPESTQFPSMPRHLIDAGYADNILRPADIPEVILAYADHPYARGGREADAEAFLERERQHLREILAILRTRSRKDFSGYKKPTLLRRVQRRMGLTRLTSMGEYARLLRQSPAEVTALGDDLLIHVTGFFRDPEAWEALRRSVIAPLVAGREPGGEIRAWVTACSSGEEAYSLAMLLSEEAERAGRSTDIKVFATDLADRALAHARAGVYPGGIESEIAPERLDRFFDRDDAVYRVKPALRDRVVFAPQNILQDPPFSRIDIASCRNLLIYLEPEVQQRVLALLHFGLREGGALFLGSSESVAGTDGLFETVDKKARIFRRVGPTRHGAVEFPLPHALPHAAEGGGQGLSTGGVPRLRRRAEARASLAELTQRALLEAHTPPAVTVDRDGHIVYYHGDTRPFLQQLTGEPTRELMLLAREGVRGAARVALHRAAAENARVAVADGWVVPEPGRRVRVAVTASPLAAEVEPGERDGPAHYFVVSFEERGDIAPPPADGPTDGPGESVDELRRLRAELQSTVEELQTSNEELKAAHEEAMSFNEELQSANEELETSKEEMQSLNEELATVNAQLRAKMEEHQAASSDLSSLLTSTDIAVLFLDAELRIRRYTPAVRELVDLIAGDVGRPLAALARRFDDPHLDGDARGVLERLVPVEREVAGADGRHYLRRVLPYRTTDNRIDGVVVTFVDISARTRAEEALRASEEQFRRAIEEAPIPVIMQAEDGRVLQVSRTWTELTGYTLADVPTAEAWLTRAYGPGADAVRAHMHELFRGDRETLGVEFAIRTKGGDERQWSFSASAPGTLRDGRRFLVGMAVDVTDRRRAADALRASEERQAFLLGLSDALRPQADPAAIKAAAARLLGEHLGVNRVLYAEVAGDDWLVADAYAQGVEPPPHRHPIAPFGRWIVDTFRAGHRLVIRDVRSDDRLQPPERAAHEALQIIGAAAVPLVKGGALVAILVAQTAAPRDWTDRDLALVEETAERTWAAVERARAEAALRAGEEKYRVLFESMDEAYAVVEVIRDEASGRWADFLFLEVNPAFVAHTGMEHPVGRTATQLLGSPNPRWAEVYGRVAETGEPVRMEEREPALDRVFDLYIFRLGGPGSRRVAVLFTDVTARKQTESALRASEERLRLALAAARMGIWTWDVATGAQMRDANLNRLLGLEAVETTQPFEEFLAHVHPDDRESVVAAFHASVQQGRPLNIEFRVVRPDGAVRWLRDQGDVFGGAGEAARYLAGACVDVTDLKEAETAVREREERLRLIVEGATDYAIFALDADRRVTSWSPGARAIFGYADEEILGRSGDLLFTPEDRAAGVPEAEALTAVREGRASDDRWLARNDGSRFFASGVLTPLGEGGALGFVKVASDLTERKRMEDALREARDELEALGAAL
jgi:two-component system, chemotaxis family, CheB/CheR fusion protein